MRRAILSLVAALGSVGAAAAEPCPPLLDRSYESLQDGRVQSLCQYRGKVLLVVNTATYCGFTGQYEGLEALQRSYRERGLVVLGFPSNDFGAQEPGSNQEIAEFCRTTYGVKFPMFAKTRVTGPDADPLFSDLAQRSGERPGWNFHKYLIDRGGERVASFASTVEPGGAELMQAIEARLGAVAPERKPNY